MHDYSLGSISSKRNNDIQGGDIRHVSSGSGGTTTEVGHWDSEASTRSLASLAAKEAAMVSHPTLITRAATGAKVIPVDLVALGANKTTFNISTH